LRFAIAVVISAITQLVMLLRIADWVGVGAYLAMTYMVFAAAGAGWFARERPALAGALSVVLGVLLYACVTFFGPAGIGTPATDLVLGILRLVVAYWTFIVTGAVAGALGGAIRRRVLGAGV
jgi:hypothetical protein